jgi:hypothetical protein
LDDFRDAFYDMDSEAICRVIIDIILIQCRKYLHNKHQPQKASHDPGATVTNTTPSTPQKANVNTPFAEPAKRVSLFTETMMSVEVPDKSVPGGKTLVCGRADWSLGYSSLGSEGALLIAMEAKKREEFSKGEAQLITYLAILRERRRRAGKINIIT